jgi:hypothetical protein
MEEQEQIRIGSYCYELLQDLRFNELVTLCESNISLQILEEDRLDDREGLYYTYKGLKELINMMQQFVTAKDQIAARKDQEENN